MKVREPVPRPLDVVVAELLLSASQAFLVGVLMYLAIGIWYDRGVGFGPVAIILAGLGLAIGGGWLYWLSGGVGWPLAAANVPTAIFLGFSLVLSWQAADVVRVEGVPLLLSLAASVYGLVCGVFLDPPRRRRWDQRQRLRPGTAVPRISPTTRMLVAQMPRGLPRRPSSPSNAPGRAGQAPWPTEAVDDTVGAPAVGESGAGPAEGGFPAPPPLDVALTSSVRGDMVQPDGSASMPAAGATTTRPDGAPVATDGIPSMPTERLDRAARAAGGDEPDSAPADDAGSIELPSALEPKAQRSPWAWAAPPEWTRDEDDVPPRSSSSTRS